MITTVKTVECDAHGCTCSDIVPDLAYLPEGWATVQMSVQGGMNVNKHLCRAHTAQIVKVFFTAYFTVPAGSNGG